jgi:hypothetical protein
MKGAMGCINCNRLVYLDEKGKPLSKYWISSDDFKSIKYVLCGPQCATDYKKKVDNEAK